MWDKSGSLATVKFSTVAFACDSHTSPIGNLYHGDQLILLALIKPTFESAYYLALCRYGTVHVPAIAVQIE